MNEKIKKEEEIQKWFHLENIDIVSKSSVQLWKKLINYFINLKSSKISSIEFWVKILIETISKLNNIQEIYRILILIDKIDVLNDER